MSNDNSICVPDSQSLQAMPPKSMAKRGNAAEGQSSDHKQREPYISQSSNKENQSYRSQSPSVYKWSDSNSPAIAGALKKLQDKIK